jgi:hypothetical protein
MTSKLTKERLLEIAEDGFLKHGESKELASMALAAMDGEPVAWTWHYREQWHVTNDERRAEFVAKDGDVAVLPLYRHAQPAPGYPEVLPCSVLLEPGLRFGKGIKTSTMLAALARRAVHESDMAALSPEERAEFHARIEDFKALISQPEPLVMDDKKLRELFDAWFASDCSFDQSPEASEADNIAWRESYWYVWQRCRGAMLQELQKSAGTEETCRGNENAQVLNTIKAPPALVSLQKNAKSLTGNSPVNDVTAGKPLTIFLPDISSKAFWSGAGKNETFHPETYRRWAKKAIERGCIIACIDVEVK